MPIDNHLLTDEADAVAVIDVPIDVADGQRLDRFAVWIMPAIDGDAMRPLQQAVGHDHVLFDPRNEQPQRMAAALLFDNLVMLIERRRSIAVLGKRPRLKM